MTYNEIQVEHKRKNMCKDCGCSITDHNDHHHDDYHEHEHEHHHHTHETLHANPQLNDPKTISVITKILAKNDHEAEHNREHFESHSVLAINMMSSPGSGKTALLEAIADAAPFKFGVIEGDLETSRDADRTRAKGITAHQKQTGSACHLDALMVHHALNELPIADLEVCFIENVGNLVCPASYDVGAHLNIVLVSVPEGEDKVEKYPVMFRTADLVLITKCDLLPYIDFDIAHAKEQARKLKPSVDIIEVSIKDSKSIKNVIQWITFKKSMRS